MFKAAFMLRLTMAALAVVLGLEWLMPPASPQVQTVRRRDFATIVKPALKRGDVADQFAATALARPLFSRSRRPPEEKTETGSAPDELPRLSGIMIAGFARHAIFEGDGKPLVTAVGDHVGDYKIIAITPATVTVVGPRGTQLVSLSFDASRKPVVQPAFIGGNLLERFRGQRPPHMPVPQPPSMDQLLGRLHRPS